MMDRFPVIGNSIGHTRPPLVSLAFTVEAGHDIDDIARAAAIGGFAVRVAAFRQCGGLGLSLTSPSKLDAFAYANGLSKRAKFAGAGGAVRGPSCRFWRSPRQNW
jgi:shikimate dehydrogenase